MVIMAETIKVEADSHYSVTLVNELKDNGLVVGKDFDWEFHQYVYDYMTGDETPAYTNFTFYDPQHATLYALKWL